DILAGYGNPTTNLDRARAIRDWLSRTAVHPYRRLHPEGSTSNLSVLPLGKTWADVNPVSMGKINNDTQFWGVVGLNGYAMLDRLLGTLEPATGRRGRWHDGQRGGCALPDPGHRDLPLRALLLPGHHVEYTVGSRWTA